jgi:GNAT superfamily N-acetyltransferase
MLALKTDEISLTGYTPGALGAVCAMQTRYYAREWGFGSAFETKVAIEMAEFLSRFDPKRDLFVVAHCGDDIVGGVTLDVSDTAGGPAHLRWFMVADGVQGRGIGQRLMARVDEFARQTGVRHIYLWTFEGLGAARALYERFDYALTESREGETWGTKVVEQKFEKHL